jgi:hypothetical protein
MRLRLSDAGLRCRQTKLLYPNHRLPSWLSEDVTPRSLELLDSVSFAERRDKCPKSNRNEIRDYEDNNRIPTPIPNPPINKEDPDGM